MHIDSIVQALESDQCDFKSGAQKIQLLSAFIF